MKAKKIELPSAGMIKNEMRHLEEMRSSASGMRFIMLGGIISVAALGVLAFLAAQGVLGGTLLKLCVGLFTLMALGSMGALWFIIFMRVVRPLAGMRQSMEQMANGQVTDVRTDFGEVSATTRLMGDSLAEMNANLASVIGDIRAVMHEIAHNGDFTTKTQAEYKGDFAHIKNSIDELTESLIDVFSKLVNISGSVLSGVQQVTEGNTELANGSTQQTADAEQLFSVITEMSDGFDKCAKDAVEANACTERVNNSVKDCKEQMDGVSVAMDNISEASSKIDQIIKTINQIAFQTNILALNAAVEAARAGEAGKGFAVVADEVRMLANNTAEAADETTQLIQRSLEAIQTGINTVAEMEETFVNVGTEALQSRDSVNAIAHEMEDYVQKIGEIKGYTSDMVNVVERNAAIAQNSQACCEELYAQVGEMDAIVRRVKI